MTVGRLEVGDRLDPLGAEPLSRLTLALYCGASNDHNPEHVDIDAARSAGFDDVFGHGMWTMAQLGRLLTERFGADRLRRFSARFVDLVHVGDELVLTGEVTEELVVVDTTCIRLELAAHTTGGELKATGTAVVENDVRTQEIFHEVT